MIMTAPSLFFSLSKNSSIPLHGLRMRIVNWLINYAKTAFLRYLKQKYEKHRPQALNIKFDLPAIYSTDFKTCSS